MHAGADEQRTRGALARSHPGATLAGMNPAAALPPGCASGVVRVFVVMHAGLRGERGASWRGLLVRQEDRGLRVGAAAALVVDVIGGELRIHVVRSSAIAATARARPLPHGVGVLANGLVVVRADDVDPAAGVAPDGADAETRAGPATSGPPKAPATSLLTSLRLPMVEPSTRAEPLKSGKTRHRRDVPNGAALGRTTI